MPPLRLVVPSDSAFAAVHANGSVIAWGDPQHGGNCDSVKEALSRNVQHIYCTEYAFAAVKTDGSVITWGLPHAGGDSEAVKEALNDGVLHIYSTESAFAAVKTDGSVVTITLRTVTFKGKGA